jgi:hypothetical protein
MSLASTVLSLLGLFAPSPPPITTRALDAASGGGKRFRRASTPSIQADANGLAARIGPRSRYAQFNHSIMSSAGRAWVANLVGCGGQQITPS